MAIPRAVLGIRDAVDDGGVAFEIYEVDTGIPVTITSRSDWQRLIDCYNDWLYEDSVS